MTPWIKRSLFALAGAGIAAGALLGCAHHRDDMRGRIVERVSSRLDLNDDQKRRLGLLADKLQQQRAALRGQDGDPRAEVKALLAGDKFDRARAQALVTMKTAAVTANSPEVIAALGDFYDSLNPAQRQKVRDMMERRHGWRGWRG